MKSIQSSASLALFALSLLAGCGSEASVVGGRCRDGMELQGRACVAPPPALALILPGAPPSGASGSSPASDGSNVGPATTPARPTPPSFVLDPNTNPYQIDPEAVLPPQLDPPIDLPPPQPIALVCEAPLVACHDLCIPVDSDPLNCGSCGHVCRSNICVAGECQGATPGDVVLIGHDYTNAWAGSTQAKVLTNALGIPLSDPIRVLSYEDGARPNAVAQVKALAGAGISGRKVEFTAADSASAVATEMLGTSYDIVLIHGAASGDAAAIGVSWASALGRFTMQGGVVIALDSGLSPMPQLLTSSGLLSVSSHTSLASGTYLAVTGAADVVGAQLLSPYAGFGAPVTFQGIGAPSADLDWVIRTAGSGDTFGDPVVVHRIVR